MKKLLLYIAILGCSACLAADVLIEIKAGKDYEIVEPSAEISKTIYGLSERMKGLHNGAIECANLAHLGTIRIKDEADAERVLQRIGGEISSSLTRNRKDQRFYNIADSGEKAKIAPNHILLLCSANATVTVLMTPSGKEGVYSLALTYVEHKK